MICVFYIHLGCVAGRGVYISIRGWQIATRESLDLETNVHDLHGASASRWTEAILCFKGFWNWGLERCNLDVWSQRDPKNSANKNPHLLMHKSFPFRERQKHTVWTISIERAWLSAELLLSVWLCLSPLTFQLCLLELFFPQPATVTLFQSTQPKQPIHIYQIQC